jgi:hypothetical protein
MTNNEPSPQSHLRVLPQIGNLPAATQAFLVALGTLAVLLLGITVAMVFGSEQSRASIKPITDGVIDLCKVLVGAFAGSLTGRRNSK